MYVTRWLRTAHQRSPHGELDGVANGCRDHSDPGASTGDRRKIRSTRRRATRRVKSALVPAAANRRRTETSEATARSPHRRARCRRRAGRQVRWREWCSVRRCSPEAPISGYPEARPRYAPVLLVRRPGFPGRGWVDAEARTSVGTRWRRRRDLRCRQIAAGEIEIRVGAVGLVSRSSTIRVTAVARTTPDRNARTIQRASPVCGSRHGAGTCALSDSRHVIGPSLEQIIDFKIASAMFADPSPAILLEAPPQQRSDFRRRVGWQSRPVRFAAHDGAKRVGHRHAGNARLAVNISSSRQPNDQMSLLPSTRSPMACSGLT